MYAPPRLPLPHTRTGTWPLHIWNLHAGGLEAWQGTIVIIVLCLSSGFTCVASSGVRVTGPAEGSALAMGCDGSNSSTPPGIKEWLEKHTTRAPSGGLWPLLVPAIEPEHEKARIYALTKGVHSTSFF